MKTLTNEELEAFKTLLEARLSTDRRNAVMLLIAVSCGLRAQELLNLTPLDLDFHAKTVRVKTLKRGVPRTIPAPKCLFDWVSSRMRESEASTSPTRGREPASIGDAAVGGAPLGPKDPLFGIGYQRLVQIWHLYRPSPKNFHCLRHTVALGLYRRRKDINLVKHVLGHKSLSSTTVYLEESYEQDTLRKAMGLK
jgi:integrase